MTDYDFFLSVGGVPTLASGAGVEDARVDPDAVVEWNFGWAATPKLIEEGKAILAASGYVPDFSQTEAYQEGEGDAPALLWLPELIVRGRLMPSWNQGQVGTCVSFGWGRNVNDVLLQMMAAGAIDLLAEDVATEPIYGGSRVEVGGGRIRGDGSVGSWAADWLKSKGGVLLRRKYGSYDLTRYSEALSRQWGNSGVPDDLEPTARQYPVKDIAQVKTFAELKKAAQSGYGTAVCSNRGFTTKLQGGMCKPSGSWNHCMAFRGYDVVKFNGKLYEATPCQNSWGGYLSGEAYYENAKGERIQLPEGCFMVEAEVAEGMLRQDDSFAVSPVAGFPRRQLDWMV